MVQHERHDAHEILEILELLNHGTPMAEVCARFGICERTLYRWRARHELAADTDHLRRLELEQRRLRRQLQACERDLASLIAILDSLGLDLDQRRRLVDLMRDTGGLSERRSCDLTGLNRSTKRYRIRWSE
jgi:transposase-like protein